MVAKMVDISPKPEAHRRATASGHIILKPETITRLRRGQVEKGDPVQIATVAGISATKIVPQLMPLCHPVRVEGTEISAKIGARYVKITATVTAYDRTGVELEALTAVTVALLNIWDVTKQYEKNANGQYPSTLISEIKVERKVKTRDAGSRRP